MPFIFKTPSFVCKDEKNGNYDLCDEKEACSVGSENMKIINT